MKKRILALLLAVVTLCPMLAACSDHYDYDSYLDYIVLGDTSKLSVNQTKLDDAVLSTYYGYYKDEIDGKTLTSVELTSGKVKFGDTVNIDYNGYLYGQTAVFEGGSTYENGTPKGTELQIGSGSYIDGFESGLIGYEVGDTVFLNLYFPEDYGKADLNGKQVRFEVKINKITKRYDYPEMTDETVKKQSGGTYNTVDEFKKGVKELTEKNEIWAAYYELSKVKEWPKDELEEYYQSTLETHKSYCTAWYGGDMNKYASAMGYKDASTFYSYIASQAAQQVKQDLLILATVEANKLEMSEADMDAKIKELYDTHVKSESFKGSFGKFQREYGRNALEIEIYTETVINFLLEKTVSVDDTKYTGFKASVKNGITFFKDGVQQFGWVNFDINRDGTEDKFYFNQNTGLAYENKAALVPVSNESNETKYHKFGRFGELSGLVNNVIESDGDGLIYAINGIPQTGFQNIDKDGRIEGNETYYFDPVTNHMLLGVHKLEIKGSDGNVDEEKTAATFGVNAGKYYNFGETGIYRLDNTTGEYINYVNKDNNPVNFADFDAKNGIADGIIDDRYYVNGELKTERQSVTVGEETNDYYFDPENDNKMVKNDFVDIDAVNPTDTKVGLYYCDEHGHIVKGEGVSKTIGNTVYAFDPDGKIISETPADSTPAQ
ncbi:MAG: FKBP-type peptidyl-prolyl cis-trans isomerase [Clostridia bacterium]|nr:FKBP-type peptidyl-prolyl cis-trans isomerase [Clostridia bacterium]